jgi:hypothetical protein
MTISPILLMMVGGLLLVLLLVRAVTPKTVFEKEQGAVFVLYRGKQIPLETYKLIEKEYRIIDLQLREAKGEVITC